MFKFALGTELKDSITGFKGIVVVRTEWLNGCKRYGLQPQKLSDGKPVETQHFDEEQLLLVSDGVKVKERRTGGDRPSVMRAADPRR